MSNYHNNSINQVVYDLNVDGNTSDDTITINDNDRQNCEDGVINNNNNITTNRNSNIQISNIQISRNTDHTNNNIRPNTTNCDIDTLQHNIDYDKYDIDLNSLNTNMTNKINNRNRLRYFYGIIWNQKHPTTPTSEVITGKNTLQSFAQYYNNNNNKSTTKYPVVSMSSSPSVTPPKLTTTHRPQSTVVEPIILHRINENMDLHAVHAVAVPLSNQVSSTTSSSSSLLRYMIYRILIAAIVIGGIVAVIVVVIIMNDTPTPSIITPTVSPISSSPILEVNMTELSLMVACNFLNYTDLNLCQSITDFSSVTSNLIGTTTIPTEIGLLTQLQYISFVNQNLTGTIPSTIGKLIQLTYLDISLNYDLYGTIPREIGNLIQLTTLSGTLPSTTIENLVQLTYLDLGGNALIDWYNPILILG